MGPQEPASPFSGQLEGQAQLAELHVTAVVDVRLYQVEQALEIGLRGDPGRVRLAGVDVDALHQDPRIVPVLLAASEAAPQRSRIVSEVVREAHDLASVTNVELHAQRETPVAHLVRPAPRPIRLDVAQY